MGIEFKPAWTDPDLDLYRDTVVRFIDSEVLPDDAQARQRGHVGHAVWRRAGALGLLCADIPEAYGGAGGDFRHEAVLYEELARRSLTGMSVSVHSIVAHYLLNHGTEAQKLRYLPRMARGELVGAIAMTEPGAGSDLQNITTRAVKGDDGHYLLNGAKTFITNGYLAGLVLVVARTDLALRARGMSILIVETEGCAGYRVGPLLDKIGLKAQDTAELFFDDVRVSADQLLGGEEGRGFAQLMSDLPYERLAVGVIAVGMMQGAFEATLRHARERQVFGKPLIELQNTRFKLAEVATRIKVARAFVDACITDLLAGRLDTVTASMVKWWASDLQGEVVDACLQLFGGYGYMNEFEIARMYVDARVQRIYGGANEIMKEVIARGL